MPQTAADLLYLETVAEECAAADGGAGPACRALLDRLVPGIPDDQHPRDLSEGQRLALALAIVLTGRPPVLLLDEPTRGLDYAAKRALAGILRDLAADGHAVLVATHDVEFVAQVADGVVVLAEGEVVSAGPDAAWSPSRRRSRRRSPRCWARRGCGSTRSAGRGWEVDAMSTARPRGRRSPRARPSCSAGVASVAGLMMLAWPLLLRVEPTPPGSTRRSCSWRCCRW